MLNNAPRVASVVLLALVVACATNPVTGRRELTFMSEAQEIGIGQENHPKILQEMGEYRDTALQRYVNDLGQRLAKTSERPQLPWHFTVVDQPVVNAFAVPGGFIYITRGILAYLDSEAELVGILGHEIGHVTARHSAQQYTRSLGGTLGLAALSIFAPAARPFGSVTEQALGVLFLKYGRDDELQSDHLGASYAAANGWDPRAVPAVLTTLGRMREGSEKGVPNWLSTHPEPASRVTEIEPYVRQLVAGRGSLVTARDEYQRRIDGLVFGDSPEQGLVRGNTFFHPPLRFRLDYPQGWEIQNSAAQVLAKAPGADVYLLFQLVASPQGRSIENIALNDMRGAGFEAVEGSRTTINGTEAFIGVYRGQMEGLGLVQTRAAHIRHTTGVFLLAGIVAQSAFQQADGAFRQTIGSFRALSAAEAEEIRPNRVDFHTVRAGETWPSIAKRGGDLVGPETLAIMNGSQPGSQPRVGARIKVVLGS